MKLSTAITRLLDIDHPILLAPMGGVARGALACEVSAAGGLSLVGAGYADPAFGYGSDTRIRGEFEEAGEGAVGVGFITWALEERPGLSSTDRSSSLRVRDSFIKLFDSEMFT